jgi:hypothetical protein
MSELAVFGSILLLVLSFLLRYAMNFNDKQQMQMETFRVALQKAATGEDHSSTVIFKDFPMADPQDEHGAAERATLSASEDPIAWDDQLQNESRKTEPGTVNYRFIMGTTAYAPPVSRTYTTAGLATKGPLTQLEVSYPGLGDRIIDRNRIGVTDDTESYPNGAVKILWDVPRWTCGERFCQTDIINEADVDADNTTEAIVNATGAVGSVMVGVMDPNEGQIDLEATDPVTGAPLQGPQMPEVRFTRADRMNTTDKGKVVSTTTHLVDTTHRSILIKLNGPPQPSSVTHNTNRINADSLEEKWINWTASK